MQDKERATADRNYRESFETNGTCWALSKLRNERLMLGVEQKCPGEHNLQLGQQQINHTHVLADVVALERQVLGHRVGLHLDKTSKIRVRA